MTRDPAKAGPLPPAWGEGRMGGLDTGFHRYDDTVFSKPIQARGIVHQYLLPHRRVRRPYRQLVQQPTVVDVEKRRYAVDAAARSVRMWPVGSPEDTVRIRRDERLGERRDIRIIRPFLRGPVGRRDLHV